MTYKILIERSAQKSLAKIDSKNREKIIEAIQCLSENPRPLGAKKLSSREGWRIRVHDYRVIYEIQDKRLVILVVSVGHRR